MGLADSGLTASAGPFFCSELECWLINFLYEIILAKSSDIIFNSTLIFLSILFLGVSIALYIIAELMKQATEYKQENELTI